MISARHLSILLLSSALIGAALAKPADDDDDAKAKTTTAAPTAKPADSSDAPDTGLTVSKATQDDMDLEISRLPRVAFERHWRGFATIVDIAKLTDQLGTLATARGQVQAATGRAEAARVAYERSKLLFHDQQTVSAAQLQTAEAAFRAEQAAQSLAATQVKLATSQIRQDWGPVIGAAALDGKPPASGLIEHELVLVQVALPPAATLTDAPTSATLRLRGGAEIELTLVSPATHSDPRLQTPTYFYTAPATSALQTGLSLPVTVSSGALGDGQKVPDAAVLRWQGGTWVYLRVAKDKFARTRLDTSNPAPDGGYVVRDLPAEAEVVTRGAQLLLSQEFRGTTPGDDD